MTRDDVLKEYEYTRVDNDLIALENEPYTAWHTDAMADEIVRLRTKLNDLREMVNATQWGETVASAELEQLRRILAALREPSDAVIVAMQSADSHGDVTDGQCAEMIRAAVIAAEQEVNGE